MKSQTNSFSIVETSGAIDMNALMAQFGVPTAPRVGSLVTGEVVAKSKEGYFVSIGIKGDSLVYDAEPGELELGQSYQFFVVSEPNDDGACGLSFKRAAVWNKLIHAAESGENVEVRIHPNPVRAVSKSRTTDRVGGLNVFVLGMKSFIPRSQLSLHGKLENFAGQTIPAKVLSADPAKGEHGEIILSHSKAVEEQELARFASLKIGAMEMGTVVAVLESGALVDVGGLAGLVYRTELAGNRNVNPKDVVQVGDEVQVKVVDLNQAKRQVSLSIRAALQDSFLTGVKKGDALTGTVARFETFGAFVLIGGCIDGLVHITDYAEEHGRRETLTVGQTVQVVVKDIDDRNRISLTRKGTNGGGSVTK